MENKICGIYKITNPSGRVYIGQSINIRARWRSYKKLYSGLERQIKLYRSFLKHGVDSHIFEILEECPFEQLNIRERYWQDFYDVLNEGLNCLLTSTDNLSKIFSKESLEKKSKSMKGKLSGSKNPLFGVRRFGEEHPMWGRNHTKESKQKNRLSHLGKKLGSDNHYTKLILNTETGIFYFGIREACESCENMNYGKLRSYLQGKAKNKTSFKYC